MNDLSIDMATMNEMDDEDVVHSAPRGVKNYITSEGLERLQREFSRLLHEERPRIVEMMEWAANNGDRAENTDYLESRRLMREIDDRLRQLKASMDAAEVVDPSQQTRRDQVFFGATVTYERGDGRRVTVTIVGRDEVDPEKRRISWQSPVASALLKGRVGDVLSVNTPAGPDEIEILAISYPENSR